jgi:hypothetical protein
MLAGDLCNGILHGLESWRGFTQASQEKLF